MSKKILILSPPDHLSLQRLKEEYGENVEIYTPEEAQKEGLSPGDFENTSYKITAPIPIAHGVSEVQKTGKEKRRERRRKSR